MGGPGGRAGVHKASPVSLPSSDLLSKLCTDQTPEASGLGVHSVNGLRSQPAARAEQVRRAQWVWRGRRGAPGTPQKQPPPR